MNLIDGLKNGTLQGHVDFMEKAQPGKGRGFIVMGLMALQSAGAITVEQRDSGFQQIGATEEEIHAATSKLQGSFLS